MLINLIYKSKDLVCIRFHRCGKLETFKNLHIMDKDVTVFWGPCNIVIRWLCIYFFFSCSPPHKTLHNNFFTPKSAKETIQIFPLEQQHKITTWKICRINLHDKNNQTILFIIKTLTNILANEWLPPIPSFIRETFLLFAAFTYWAFQFGFVRWSRASLKKNPMIWLYN